MVIPPPLHHFRMEDFGFVDAQLWYNIDHNFSQPCSENKNNESLRNYIGLFGYYHKT